MVNPSDENSQCWAKSPWAGSDVSADETALEGVNDLLWDIEEKLYPSY
jgi:hypothetical protein